MNLIDELRVALMPPRRRVSFLLGGAVSSSILRGDSETERLLEEVVDDGLDDEDPFFFGEKALLTDKTRIHLRSASVRTYTFFTTGFPRLLSIRGARGLLALNQVLI
jgi:hypothetical protein